jgi:hypothetical protein
VALGGRLWGVLRVLVVAGVIVLVLLVAGQLFLPRIAASQVEHRLTKPGGHAKVSLRAFPAWRLLFHHGSEIRVTGDGLSFQLNGGGTKVFQKLDGFERVHVHLTNVSAGPFTTAAFSLDRAGGAPTYTLALRTSFTPSQLSSFLGSQVAGGLGGLFGSLAGGLVGGSTPVPVDMSAQVQSEDGRPRVVSGGGTVAGLPMGPLLEVVAVAIVAQL